MRYFSSCMSRKKISGYPLKIYRLLDFSMSFNAGRTFMKARWYSTGINSVLSHNSSNLARDVRNLEQFCKGFGHQLNLFIERPSRFVTFFSWPVRSITDSAWEGGCVQEKIFLFFFFTQTESNCVRSLSKPQSFRTKLANQTWKMGYDPRTAQCHWSLGQQERKKSPPIRRHPLSSMPEPIWRTPYDPLWHM